MRCQRCRGCLIRDSFEDLRDDTGHLQFEGWRCINCGEVIDPVVLTHRVAIPPKPYRGQSRDRRTWERIVPERFERCPAV